MTRSTRNTAILAKIETTYGVDATPAGSTDALLISDASFEIQANNVSRDLIRGYYGSSEELVGTRFVQAQFTVEISGSGAAGTAPAWGKLLQACAFAETVNALVSVEYRPVSTAIKSLSIYYFKDGARRKLLGARGTVTLAMGEGERPVFQFTFWGLDGGVSATANPALTLTAWKAPAVITDSNSGDVLLGCTYASAALSGGTAYPSRGLQIDAAGDVRRKALLGGQSVEVADRAMAGSLQLELTAAQEVSFITDINANTLTSVGFEHGTAAGSKVLVFAPKVQRINPRDEDFEGSVHMSMDLRLTPDAGNDELIIVAA